MQVVVVESPAKAKTVGRYLGDGYRVLATLGHVSDLPAREGSVRPAEGFAMSYETGARERRALGRIAAALDGADGLILATDPDREGEAIAWQVLTWLRERGALGARPVQRVAFREITPEGVRAAMASPRALDMDLVRAQQARRALDYLVGFHLSPVLWRKLPGSRSAGRVAFWGTLALMRCVGSSPAAALSALRNRMAGDPERLEPRIYDEDGDDEDAVDIEPDAVFETDPALLDLVDRAERLIGEPDPKLEALVGALTPLLKQGVNPVVFCRFLATAEHVRNGLRKAFPKLRIESVTGVLTPDERRARVDDMAPVEDEKEVQRILVATDCLSEGINLQQLFDTAVHYDLSWNPTRHQQREGRVDRFGQPADLVRSIMMYSPDSAIDGAVLDVILRKAEEIRKATGVTVPLPDERGPVTDALMASMMLRRGTKQLALDLRLDSGERLMESGTDSWLLSRACDLYVAAFLAPKIVLPATTGPDGLPRRGAETVPTSGTVWEYLRGVRPFGLLVQNAERALDDARPMHWPLEFPDIMARGGFDIVLGNPPWERIKLQEQEFFAARAPEIAGAPNKAARARLIAALETAPENGPERALHAAFVATKRQAEAVSEFVRVPGGEGGRFALTGRGDVNTYALFAELFSNLARDRAGVIVPTGIATDATTAAFFAALVAERRLAKLVDFENRERIFSGVYFRVKFCLLTMGRNEGTARFAFFLTDPAQLTEPERNFTLGPERIAAINPNTRTAPVFRSRADAELTAKIYANAPVLIDEGKGREGNPWGVSFMAMFHMSNDSGLFRTARQLAEDGFVRDGTDWVPAGHGPPKGALPAEETDSASLLLASDEWNATRYVPLYEGKMAFFFDHRYGNFLNARENKEADYREIPRPALEQLRNPDFEVSPRYWVPKDELASRLDKKCWKLDWLFAHRGLTNATNERTLVTFVLPRNALGNSIPTWIFNVEMDKRKIGCLTASTASIVCDFVARQKLGGTNLNFFYLQQFPILPPHFFTEMHLVFVIPRVLELTYTSHSLASFAHDLGHTGPPFAWNEERRAQLRAELDAFYARAYGLTRDELRYILDPADAMGPGYPSETFRVLKDKEVRQFGEYRTRRLVLAAWDRMEASGEFRELGL